MSKRLKDLYSLAMRIEKQIENDGKLKDSDHQKFVESLESSEIESFKRLSKRVKPGMSLEQFICFVVPIERELNKKITDSEILVEKDDLETNGLKKNELIIILDNIRSPFNMGAIVRSCDALGVKTLITTGYTPDLTDARVQKVSKGAFKSIEHMKYRRLSDVIEKLKEDSYTVIGVETANDSKIIHEVKLPLKSAFVFGNERFGISETDLTDCDLLVKLSMFGFKNSLNVNAALTTCGYEWVRQNGII